LRPLFDIFHIGGSAITFIRAEGVALGQIECLHHDARRRHDLAAGKSLPSRSEDFASSLRSPVEWWATFGEQTRVICRECRSLFIIALVTSGIVPERMRPEPGTACSAPRCASGGSAASCALFRRSVARISSSSCTSHRPRGRTGRLTGRTCTSKRSRARPQIHRGTSRCRIGTGSGRLPGQDFHLLEQRVFQDALCPRFYGIPRPFARRFEVEDLASPKFHLAVRTISLIG